MALREQEQHVPHPDRLPRGIAYNYLSFLLGDKLGYSLSSGDTSVLLTRDQEDTGEPCINVLALERDSEGKIVAGEEDIIDRFGQATRLRTLSDKQIITFPERTKAGKYISGAEDYQYAQKCGITIASFTHNLQQADKAVR